MRVRAEVSGTGFTTWDDELGLDRWRTGDVFGDSQLPVLFAHGQHNRPDSVVLATTEYRRAYEGKLSRVLGRLVDSSHLVWIGFSFADQRIAAILREVAQASGTRVDPGAAPRHVAIMPWDPDAEGNDPDILAERAAIRYGATVVLYPAVNRNHYALEVLLSALIDPRYPAAPALPAAGCSSVLAQGGTAVIDHPDVPVMWVPEAEALAHFTGQTEELARLHRWAADPEVRLVGVTAWGGAGKTALVTHWVQQADGPRRRPGLQGAFGWSFYADASAEHWANHLVEWAGRHFGGRKIYAARPAARVLELLRTVPLLLVLDGLEVAQEGPAGDRFGRLLDGTLREVLTGACRMRHAGLVLLTSRFPFADLEAFDGISARMLDVPPFTPAEGAELLTATGGGWLPVSEQRELVAAVDGHALAVGVLAGILASHPPGKDLQTLQAELSAATRTDTRVQRVLGFYTRRLAEADRYLIAAVSLFTHPVSPAAVLTVAGHDAFGGHLAGWTPDRVLVAVHDRLAGLVSTHPDGTLSAHPLVRGTFRPLVLEAAQAAAEHTLTDLPQGQVMSRADAVRVTEAIELLLDAGHWEPADNLYRGRTNNGRAWLNLPAARLGQRAATAFVASAARQETCTNRLSPRRLGFYLNSAGLHAMNAGDLATARDYLVAAIHHNRDVQDTKNQSIDLRNLAECLGRLGEAIPAQEAAAGALECATNCGDRTQIGNAQVFLGWLAALAGQTIVAENEFTAADYIYLTDDPYRRHLYAIAGVWWAEFMALTGRTDPARRLTEANREFSRRNSWNEDVARCDRLLGRLALASGDTTAAAERLGTAVACFRDGDFLVELAITVTDQAECARRVGDLDAAYRHATEALTIAAPRDMIPTQAAALATRARIYADRAANSCDTTNLAQGRDAADAALRLTTHGRHVPWSELDALGAHAQLDQAERTSNGWADRASILHDKLAPPGLDPDPLTTVEHSYRRT
jgi:SIR2-like domain